MNKKIIIGAVVVVVLALAGYFILAGKPVVPQSVSPSASPEQESVTPSSLRDLIAKGISQSCTYSTGKSQGTIYMTTGKIRGDFEVTAVQIGGQTMTSHMIILDNTNYIWTDGAKTGIKMSFDSNATPVATSASPASSFDANAELNYKCSAWTFNPSLFTLPVGVQFMAFSTPAPARSSAPVTGSNSSQCSYCDILTGNSKTQCLTALKCK